MQIVTPYDHITSKIIGAAMRVHNQLGTGFSEKVYEGAMCVEFDEAGLKYERQKKLEVWYRGKLVGEYIADLVVESTVLVENKAVERVLDEHKAQVINYLTCTGLDVGLILNFGPELVFRRLLSRKLFPSGGPQPSDSAG